MPHVPSVGMGRGWLESFAVETCRKNAKGKRLLLVTHRRTTLHCEEFRHEQQINCEDNCLFFPKAQGWSLDTFLQKEPIPHPPLLNKNWAIFMR